MKLLAATDRAALRVLRRHLGVLGAVRVGLAVRLGQARGAPFSSLASATTASERASREQAGAAVLLYRALHARDPRRALELSAEVVRASALVFLDEALGPLTPESLRDVPPEQRRGFVSDRIGRFPNVEATVDRAEPEGVAFTVTRCRLVELVHQAGHPELAPLFCTADAWFFGGARPGLRLHRPSTIASGHPSCRFSIQPLEAP